ncbi:hypothetical protein ACFLRO_02285 [Bacteroidota bacterium]
MAKPSGAEDSIDLETISVSELIENSQSELLNRFLPIVGNRNVGWSGMEDLQPHSRVGALSATRSDFLAYAHRKIFFIR